MCRWWEVGTNQGKVMADERNVWGVKHGYLSVVEYTVSVWDLEYGQLLSRSRPMPESVDLVSNHLFAAFHLICWLKFFLYDGRFVSPSKISRISRICSRFPKRHSNGQASRQRFGLWIIRWGSIVPWVASSGRNSLSKESWISRYDGPKQTSMSQKWELYA